MRKELLEKGVALKINDDFKITMIEAGHRRIKISVSVCGSVEPKELILLEEDEIGNKRHIRKAKLTCFNQKMACVEIG